MKKVIIIFMCIIACTSCSNKEVNDIIRELKSCGELGNDIEYSMYYATAEHDTTEYYTINDLEDQAKAMITYLNSQEGEEKLLLLKSKLNDIKEKIDVMDNSEKKTELLNEYYLSEYSFERKIKIKNTNTDFSRLTEDEKADMLSEVRVLKVVIESEIDEKVRNDSNVLTDHAN